VTFEEYDGNIPIVGNFMQLIKTQQLNAGINALLRIEQIQVTMLEKQRRVLDKQN